MIKLDAKFQTFVVEYQTANFVDTTFIFEPNEANPYNMKGDSVMDQ